MQTPSQRIIAEANATKTVTDSLGRVILYRRLGALDRARLFKAAGAVHAQNAPFIGMAMIACSCTMVDGVPVPFPAKESDIDHAISRVADEGMQAVTASMIADQIVEIEADASADAATAAATGSAATPGAGAPATA